MGGFVQGRNFVNPKYFFSRASTLLLSFSSSFLFLKALCLLWKSDNNVSTFFFKLFYISLLFCFLNIENVLAKLVFSLLLSLLLCECSAGF